MDCAMNIDGIVVEKPYKGMTFDSEEDALKSYNLYSATQGFSVRINSGKKNVETGQWLYRTIVCAKEGFKKGDKRDSSTRNPRADTRLGCPALMSIKLTTDNKYVVYKVVHEHNHPMADADFSHMLRSHRSISEPQAQQIDMTEDSGIDLRTSHELMGRQVGARESIGFLKVDQKNYLRTRRQNMLAFGEAGSILKYFQGKTLENPSFFHAVQLDNEEQITNIFWADAQMIMDYMHFGDAISFDTTYKINRENRPFALFSGFNHHREVVVFGAALMYDETADSFIWLFETFLEAMSDKYPQTIFTDQDAAMAKALKRVMPNSFHRLCKWHMMQNAVKHLNFVFRDYDEAKWVLGKFFDDYENESDFVTAWGSMLEKYDLHDNTWLSGIFEFRQKWGRPYVRLHFSAGMRSTQISESMNKDLKRYLKSDHNLIQFFMHFERVLESKRYKELDAEYALWNKLPKVRVNVDMLVQAGKVYTTTIFEEFQTEYLNTLQLSIVEEGEDSGGYFYIFRLDVNKHKRRVTRNEHDFLSCECRLFEMRGVVCSHVIYTLIHKCHTFELPDRYILKRWTRKAKTEKVQDMRGNVIQSDPKREQTRKYRSLCSLFRIIASRASEMDETYKMAHESGKNLLDAIEDVLQSYNSGQSRGLNNNENEVQPTITAKGLKKRNQPEPRGKRRLKSSLEKNAPRKRSKSQRVSSSATITNGTSIIDAQYNAQSQSSVQEMPQKMQSKADSTDQHYSAQDSQVSRSTKDLREQHGRV